MSESNNPYEGEAGRTRAQQYETVSCDELYRDVLDHLPPAPATILDIGAGTGRDSAWLTSKGYTALAVEPSKTMREEGAKRHPDAQITWLADRLPSLDSVFRYGVEFDLILLSAVWQHVAPEDRTRAFRKIVNLLKPGGTVVLSLRLGTPDQMRGMHIVSAEEIMGLARAHGMMVQREIASSDQFGRSKINWTTFVLKLPDDGTGALPLLRHVILNDRKSSTYKLGLLRALVRIANSSQGIVKTEKDGTVSLPLGLVALNWLRLYKPLIAAGLPQAPKNIGTKGLGFIKEESWSQIQDIPPADLRAGAEFTLRHAPALHSALRNIAKTIVEMPATYMTYPGSNKPILATQRSSALRKSTLLWLEKHYLWSFGEVTMPAHLWRALVRFGAWIEPALIEEWFQEIKRYADNQGRSLDRSSVDFAMSWHDPQRDVGFVRRRALELFEDRTLYCVWTGRKLRNNHFDIDHCFPWAAWPCEDLWNLLPSSPGVNRNEKRAKLPALDALERSGDRIQSWWEQAWIHNQGTKDRFMMEAKTSLPVPPDGDDLDAIFSGMQARRFAIRADHQIAEWSPK